MSDVFATVLQFLPLLLILWLANLSEAVRRTAHPRGGMGLAVISYTLLSLILLFLFLIGLILHLLGEMLQSASPEALESLRAMGWDPAFAERFFKAFPRMGLSLWVPSLIGLLLLFPPVRRLTSRLIPIDPAHRVHAVSLSASMLIWVYFLAIVSIGIETMVRMTSQVQQTNPLPSMWAQQITFFFIALIGVGWLSRRSWKEALHRLGMVRIGFKRLMVGIGAGLGLVAVALLLENIATIAGFPTDPDVEKLTRQLIGPLYGSVFGILTLGLAAALGEEAIFRGALLPRFGLFTTTLLFALVHSNYGISLSTLIVFTVGLVLGWMRLKYDTSTTMVVHAVYNITLGILANTMTQ